MTLSFKSENADARAKEGISLVNPENYWKSFNELKTLLDDMYTVRNAVGSYCPSHVGTSYTGDRDFEGYDTAINNIKACSCNSRQQTSCDCQARTSANVCNCNSRDTSCDCQARTAAASCSCDCRYACDCVSRTTCDCNVRTSCDCQSRYGYVDCDCYERCGGAEPWASGRYWTCVCFSRGEPACYCEARTGTGSYSVTCSCYWRCGCDCVSRTTAPTCYCNARTAVCDCVSRTSAVACTCEGRCSCDTVKEFV